MSDSIELKKHEIEGIGEAIRQMKSMLDYVGNMLDRYKSAIDTWLASLVEEQTPAVQTVQPPRSRPHKCGFTKKSYNGKNQRIKFRVVFGDGTVIDNCKFMHEVYVRALEKIGERKIAKLGWKFASEPLVTKNEDELGKYKKWTKRTSRGWYVATHMNNIDKMNNIERLGKALNIEVRCELK